MKIGARVFFICLRILCLYLCSSSSWIPPTMADKTTPQSSSTSEAAVHIIYTQKPAGEDSEAYHMRTLSSVVGSEEAAKGALLYNYKHAASGFSAKLTPAQVSEMSKQPGVLQVIPSGTAQLHSATGNVRV